MQSELIQRMAGVKTSQKSNNYQLLFVRLTFALFVVIYLLVRSTAARMALNKFVKNYASMMMNFVGEGNFCEINYIQPRFEERFTCIGIDSVAI